MKCRVRLDCRKGVKCWTLGWVLLRQPHNARVNPPTQELLYKSRPSWPFIGFSSRDELLTPSVEKGIIAGSLDSSPSRQFDLPAIHSLKSQNETHNFHDTSPPAVNRHAGQHTASAGNDADNDAGVKSTENDFGSGEEGLGCVADAPRGESLEGASEVGG